MTSNINQLINLAGADLLLITIFGGALIGFGSKLIYKEGYFVSGADILEIVGTSIVGPNGKVITYMVDLLIVIFSYINYGIEKTMYSLIGIIIIEYISKRGALGTSDTKVFYIITKEERKVKRFILKELKCGLTIFDVKGGYSNDENKVIMSAIPTKEYYRVREAIKKIDPSAFITITDSYEVINVDLSK